MVFKVGAGEYGGSHDEPKDYYNRVAENVDTIKPFSTIHGYVVALKDATATAQYRAWSTYNVAGKTQPQIYLKQIYSGYLPTEAAKESSMYEPYLDACKAVVNYRPEGISSDKPAAPQKSSGWYFPSKKQMEDLHSFLEHFIRRRWLADVGDVPVSSVVYWTSTENNRSSAYYAGFKFDGSDLFLSKAKGNNCRVRSVLTF